MLVTTRQAGQAIVIGGKIRVVILKGGKHVRVGVEAPEDVPILREEVLDKIRQQQKPTADELRAAAGV